MPALRFDGANDNLILGPGGTWNAQQAHTWVIVFCRAAINVWHALIDGENAAGTTVLSAVECSDLGSGNTISFSDAGNESHGSSTTQIISTTNWYLVAVSTPGGGGSAQQPRVHRADLTAGGTMLHENGNLSFITNSTTIDRIVLGEWAGVDDGNFWVAAAARFAGNLSDSQCAELAVNKRTSDIYNCSFGHPASLWQFNAVGLISDLVGTANETSRNGTALDGAAGEPWTYDGITAGATGQPAFLRSLPPMFRSLTGPRGLVEIRYAVEDGALPLFDTDALVLGESVQLDVAVSATNGLSLSEILTLQELFNTSDTVTISEANTLAQLISTTDSLGFADAYQLTAQLSQVDGLTLSEAVSAAAALAATDSWTMSDTLALSELFSVSDAATLSDTAVVSALALLSVSDAFTLTDAYQLAAQLSRTDAAGLSDTGLIAAALSASDALSESEAATIAAALSAADSITLSEASLLAQLILVTDSGALSESPSIAAALSASDSFTQSAASAATIALQVSDLGTLAEAASVAAALGISDSLVFTEAGVLTQTQLKIATDAFALSDNGVLQTASPPPDFNIPTTASIAIWAASAVLASNLTSVTLTPNDTSATATDNPTSVAVAPTPYGAEIVPYNTSVVLD